MIYWLCFVHVSTTCGRTGIKPHYLHVFKKLEETIRKQREQGNEENEQSLDQTARHKVLMSHKCLNLYQNLLSFTRIQEEVCGGPTR